MRIHAEELLIKFRIAPLLEIPQNKSTPTSLSFSPDNTHFVTTSIADRQVRVFDFASGKLRRKYDESLSAIQEMQQAGTAVYHLDDMEFGRRLALERDLENTGKNIGSAVASAAGACTGNAVFDDSGHFIIYPTMLGIKSERPAILNSFLLTTLLC